jgi:hypothetical protein
MRQLAHEWEEDKDCPWWYLERTAVGFFSASVWSQGGKAIEEYGTDKKSRTHRKKTCNGRGDLMFSVNTRSRGNGLSLRPSRVIHRYEERSRHSKLGLGTN